MLRDNFAEFIFSHTTLFGPAIYIRKLLKEFLLMKNTINAVKLTKDSQKKRIFYFGIPVHGNLGDLAQGVCIRKWINKNYKNSIIVEIETNAVVNTHFSVLKKLKRYVKSDELFIFQSGYTTTDLGGFADEMHKAVIQTFPNNPMVMMPQTVFFQSENRKNESSRIYNAHKNMLFLARDTVSFKTAKEMFPDILVNCFPDIVTTMIGQKKYLQERDGIIFCLRDDQEKYYSDEELDDLINKCKKFAITYRTDTTKDKKIVASAERYIRAEIEKYSEYKLMITDRYHGTILSLVAGTPVIIIKTTDHKVTTGANWFKGIYDEYVYLADSLNEALELAKKLYYKNLEHELSPYFEVAYYDRLPKLIKEIM